MQKISGSYIIGYDFSKGKDSTVLIVGRPVNGKIEVINTFQGPDAEELFKKLTLKEK